MSPHAIRRIDAWLGVPLCWLLTLCRRLGQLLGRRTPDGPPKRILFLKLVELGANVQAAAAVQRAVERVGRENVYFWVFAENRPILDLLDLVPAENVLGIRSNNPFAFALDLLRTLWRIRRLRIDAVVDMEFFARASAVLAYLSGARRRAGLHRFNSAGPYRGDLLTHRIQNNPYTHVSAYFYLLVEALWEDARELPMPKRPLPDGALTPPQFAPRSEEVAHVRAMLQSARGGPIDGPVAILNPNASDIVPLRKWPAERFVQLGRRLLQADPRLTIAVTGAPAERQAAEAVVEAVGSPRAVSLAGKTTLRELLVLYGLCDVLVTNDSGPAQFAALTPIDAVVLFGPETPRLWGPLGGERTHVLWAGLACSPCIGPFNFRFSPCRNPRCMTDITVEQVVRAAQEALRRRERADDGDLNEPPHREAA